MGASASRSPPCMLITLDALGTLYRFKEPLHVQYRKIATSCGLKATYDDDDLKRSFKEAFKGQSSLFPNYGKEDTGSGALSSPQVWWEQLVRNSFSPLVGEESLPENLGQRLYQHFSSGSAYELFPDVKPFLDVLSDLRTKKYADPEGPMLITGIVTNSDPRVRNVLNSLGVRSGHSKLDTSASSAYEHASKLATSRAASGDLSFASPFQDMYNTQNDFDFLATSYETGFEKPNPQIFGAAKGLAVILPLARYERAFSQSGLLSSIRELTRVLRTSIKQVEDASWIHIGDELQKDYNAAATYGIDSLLVDREDTVSSDKVQKISSLEEAASVISVMASERLKYEQSES